TRHARLTAELVHHLKAAGAPAVLWVYLLLHICIGALLPYRRSVRPLLYRLSEKTGRILEQRLNRPSRTPAARQARGAVVAALMGWCAWMAGTVAEMAAMPSVAVFWTIGIIVL